MSLTDFYNDNLFKEFLLAEPEIQDPETEKLAFLDRGYITSWWAEQIDRFHERLQTIKINNYPDRGVIPSIDLNFLSFLHENITEACLCVVEGNSCHWFGRRPTDRVQLWSATKFLPIYYLLSRICSKSLPYDWLVKEKNQASKSFLFSDLVDLVFTYNNPHISSNSLALMFKSFYSPLELEHWLHSLTGHYDSVFQGGYGEASFLMKPVLTEPDGRELLTANYYHQGENLVSPYDLTLALSHLAWLEKDQCYDVLIQAMAKDTARYLDVALEKRSLGHLADIVILSKLGFGRSSLRKRTELVYCALLSSQELSFCLTYRAALDLNDPAQEARWLDALMATEVTKTIGELGW